MFPPIPDPPRGPNESHSIRQQLVNLPDGLGERAFVMQLLSSSGVGSEGHGLASGPMRIRSDCKFHDPGKVRTRAVPAGIIQFRG
jgi:hypothetical protein